MPGTLELFGTLVDEVRKCSFSGRMEIAQDIAASARSDAPVLTGAYRGGIDVAAYGDRVLVVDNDEDAVYKEYGTVDTPAHASLTDAARVYGRYSGWEPR